MQKGQLLLVGVGKTGNVLVNEMLNKDKRYVGLMVNSAMGDMVNLKNYDLCEHFLFAGADGSGKDRNLAKGYMKKGVYSLTDTLIKFNQEIVTFFCSSDGGTGSGTTPMIIKSLKRAYPNKKVMIVAIMPSINEKELSLRNAIDFWNELVDLKNKQLVDTIYLVDNNKRRTYEEINEEVANTLDKAFSLNTFDTTGTIDQNDSKRINTATGYSFIMPLSNRFHNIADSIDDSIKDSVFIPPTNYQCDYLGSVLQKRYYNIDDLKTKFDVYKSDYCGYSETENLIVLGGLSIPKEGIDYIQLALKDVEKKNRKEEVASDLYVKVETNNEETKGESKKETITSSNVSSAKLNQLFDDNFWDD